MEESGARGPKRNKREERKNLTTGRISTFNVDSTQSRRLQAGIKWRRSKIILGQKEDGLQLFVAQAAI